MPGAATGRASCLRGLPVARSRGVEMPNGTGSVELGGAEWEIDPNSWLLMEEDGANAGAEGDH